MKKILGVLVAMLAVPVFAARTMSQDPLQKFKFRVTIPGLPTTMGFQKCSGLSEEVAVTEYQEGGHPYTHKLPGRPKVGEVTLERGEYIGTDFHSLVRASITNENARNTIIIEKLRNNGAVGRTYKLAEAWASKWEGSDMDASSDDVAIEKITLQFEYFL